jgi:NADH-quinone oxidoreductase subunit L
MDNFGLIWAVLLLPCVGFLLLSLLGARLEKLMGRKLLGAVAVIPIAVAFAIGVALTLKLGSLDAAHRVHVVGGPQWIDILGLRIPFELTVDPLSLTMTLIVTGIGALIFLYSTGYMAEDREYARFFTYLNLFAASMLLLVLANNLPLLFVGWEGVGLCSYLLIGFWYKDLNNVKAANKAFIVNRIGDWGLMLGIFLILVLVANGKSQVVDGRLLSYDTFNKVLLTNLVEHPAIANSIALLLFVGAAGKSAQFPLYLWLPDAMAGPTPVSALIHAATMVTSGVVLLNRMHVVFEASPLASAIVCGIGAFTALYAAIIAFGQTDIKKVLAYSTVSQLGYMFIGCGAGVYWAGMFHVTTHAFFKALLFLGAGSVIHAMAHDQDMRHYGNLRKYLPVTFWTMVAGWLAISAIGIPGVFGFAGYYSKEALLGGAFGSSQDVVGGLNIATVAGAIGIFTALLTAGYMTRLIWLTFAGKERWHDIPEPHAHSAEIHPLVLEAPMELSDDPYRFFYEAPIAEPETHEHGLRHDHTPKEVSPSMWIPLVVLAILSTVGGFVLDRGDLLKNWLAPISSPILIDPPAPTTFPLAWISVGAAVLGILAGIYIVRKEKFSDSQWSELSLWARRQFGFDDAVTKATIEGGAQFGSALYFGVELGLIDRIVLSLWHMVSSISEGASRIQRGLVRSYALMMLLGGLLIVGYRAWGSHPSSPQDSNSRQTTAPAQPALNGDARP